MTLALRRIVAAQTSVLHADEQVIEAGRGRSVKGTESAQHFPPSTIWAVTDRRVLVFGSRNRGDTALAKPIVALELGSVVTGARIEPFDDRDVLLVVDASGHPAMVLMDRADAEAIVDGILSTGPKQQDAFEPGDAVVGFVGDGSASESGPRSKVNDVVGSYLAGVDPSVGDERIHAIRTSLQEGSWLQAKATFVAANNPSREWIALHLWGDDLTATLDDWVAHDPECADAFVMRGANLALSAEIHRANEESEDRYFAELALAERDLFAAFELDKADPVPFTILVRTGAALGIPFEELCMRFDESTKRCPDLIGAHLGMLEALSPRGRGTSSEMFAFARTIARAAPEGSPLHALVPYAHLISAELETKKGSKRRSITGAAHSEIELFTSMSLESAAWHDQPGSLVAANIVAAALARCDQVGRAHDIMERHQFLRTARPWVVLENGDELFKQVVG